MIYSSLTPKYRRVFARAERAWAVYRNDLCTPRVSGYGHGTGGPVEAGICDEEITSAHLRTLIATQTLLTQH